MDKIKVLLIDCDDIGFYTQLACKVTRAANEYDDPMELVEDIQGSPWNADKINEMLKLPHSKVSRFTDFTFLITGTSRRFLAQLMTHHIGISVMSGSLQYSDHSKKHLNDMFVVPHNLLVAADTKDIQKYIDAQADCFEEYNELIQQGYTNDDAGYTMPQSLRNVLLVKVNLEELRFIGNQRLCKRNTDETRYVFGRMIQEVCQRTGIDDSIFAPSCYTRPCPEGKYCCGHPLINFNIKEYLQEEFPNLK
jgi:thymidylate synthase (FAD)